VTRKKILVIDDEPNIVKMVQARLEASGYEVIPAFDGNQGMTYARKEKPDLIISDIMMPAGGGYTLYKKLKMSSHTWSIPVIFLTAKDRPEDVAEAYELGAQYYLKKPYDPQVLLELVEKVLEPSVQPQAPRGLRRRILVIEKHPKIVEFIKLGALGYEITIVSSIKEGSDEAKREKPDVILLDGMLVKADNYDGFYQLKLEFGSSKIPIIICTTEGELEEFQNKLKGHDTYCLKPFNYTDLLGRIRVALQKN
jgi:DNA-binding response OmpR family regulator